MEETISLLLGAGWTCLDVNAYNFDVAPDVWKVNVHRALWVSPEGGQPMKMDEARTAWARVELDHWIAKN